MGLQLPRREFLLGMAVASTAIASSFTGAAKTGAGTCWFRLAVINDEITQDFEKACQIVSADFGLHWIELRSTDITRAGAQTGLSVSNSQGTAAGLTT